VAGHSDRTLIRCRCGVNVAWRQSRDLHRRCERYVRLLIGRFDLIGGHERLLIGCHGYVPAPSPFGAGDVAPCHVVDVDV
jgi:hypothetical protein